MKRFEDADDSGGAIVCHHVAEKRRPILLALRDDPVELADSGWQFLCGSDDHEDVSTCQLWSVREVTDLEPSLTELVDLPSGVSIGRDSAGAQWKIEVTS